MTSLRARIERIVESRRQGKLLVDDSILLLVLEVVVVVVSEWPISPYSNDLRLFAVVAVSVVAADVVVA